MSQKKLVTLFDRNGNTTVWPAVEIDAKLQEVRIEARDADENPIETEPLYFRTFKDAQMTNPELHRKTPEDERILHLALARKRARRRSKMDARNQVTQLMATGKLAPQDFHKKCKEIERAVFARRSADDVNRFMAEQGFAVEG